jgi:hypothetical protein
MVRSRITRLVALTTGLAVMVPTAAAQAGGGAPPVDPPIVGVPIVRTQIALGNAADAIDAGNGAQAVGPLRASRRYLIRSYKGAKYLIANVPPPPAGDGSANPRLFRRLARRIVRASRTGATSGWIRARSSGAEGTGPAFADGPTAVFDVFGSQFSAATAAVGMAPDVSGTLLTRVQTTLNTAVVLRNRLVKIIHASEPPAPPVEDGRVHARASGAPVAATFGSVMPGLTVLLDAELQQMKATQEDTSVPAASRAALSKAIAADTQIEALVNQWWPPVVDD